MAQRLSSGPVNLFASLLFQSPKVVECSRLLTYTVETLPRYRLVFLRFPKSTSRLA